MSFLVLSQHEQFYTEKSFCVRWVGQSLIPPKFKDFPALIAIFEAFQGLEFVF